MSELLDGPHGPVRVPVALERPQPADSMTASFGEEEVVLTFIRTEEADGDGIVGEAVGRIVLPRDSFVNMVDWFRYSVDSRRLRRT